MIKLTTVKFYNFQASLNHRANDCSCFFFKEKKLSHYMGRFNAEKSYLFSLQTWYRHFSRQWSFVSKINRTGKDLWPPSFNLIWHWAHVHLSWTQSRLGTDLRLEAIPFHPVSCTASKFSITYLHTYTYVYINFELNIHFRILHLCTMLWHV
jgi:hypothetical protein